MTSTNQTPASRIAGDLAQAIHRGRYRPGEKLPSQSQLMADYNVASATAAAALTKLAHAGLAHREVGRGTYVSDVRRAGGHPALDILDASWICAVLASTTFAPGDTTVTLPCADITGPADPSVDAVARRQPRVVDVSALVALDQRVLRWMADMFLAAAREIVAGGHPPELAVGAARAIQRDRVHCHGAPVGTDPAGGALGES